MMTVTVQAMIMVFGALTAGAGLLLLFLRKEQAQNKVKLFGQEFEISTPALVVFLCGCAVFVLPVLRPAEELNRPAIVLGSGAPADGRSATTHGGVPIGGDEKEPNDQISDGNVMQFNTRVRGVIATDEDRDYFTFRTPDRPIEKAIVILRKLRSGGFWGKITAYNSNETKIASGDRDDDDPVSLSFEVSPKAAYYVLVTSRMSGRGPYELEVRQQ